MQDYSPSSEPFFSGMRGYEGYHILPQTVVRFDTAWSIHNVSAFTIGTCIPTTSSMGNEM